MTESEILEEFEKLFRDVYKCDCYMLTCEARDCCECDEYIAVLKEYKEALKK